MQLLIWTNSPAKLDYFSHLLASLSVDIKNPQELGINAVPEETGQTEIENSLQKAQFFYEQSGGIPSFSDDAGMHIDELNGDPGLKVRRWKGELPNEVDDETWLKFFLEKTKHIPLKKRTGRFTVWRVLYAWPDKVFTQTWQRNFHFGLEPDYTKYKKGWPTSTLTIETELNKSWEDLNLEEKLKYEKGNIEEIAEWIQQLK